MKTMEYIMKIPKDEMKYDQLLIPMTSVEDLLTKVT